MQFPMVTGGRCSKYAGNLIIQNMRISSSNASVRSPRRERDRLRVAALLDAAGSGFADRGFDGATMTEIAARAGASIGLLYGL